MSKLWRHLRTAKRPLVLAVLLGLSAVGVACRQPPPVEKARPVLRVSAAFSPLAEPLTAEYKRSLPHIDVRSTAGASSSDALSAIRQKTADLGVAFASDTYQAYWAPREPNTTSEIRGVALLPPLPEYLVVRAHSGIKSVADLAGKVVVTGPANSSSSILGRLVLEAFGVKTADVKATGSRAEAAKWLREKSADAVFFPGYIYPDEVMRPAYEEGAYFIPIEGPAVERLRQEQPFVRITMIPRNIFPGQDKLVPTVGIDMMVICHRDLDEAVVYEATKQLFIAFPRLSGVEASLRFLNPDDAAATPIPLHPGAARYFRERELSR